VTRRRVLLLAAGAIAAPFSAFGQSKDRLWRVGHLTVVSRDSYLESGRHDAFILGMRNLGYVEGKHFVLESRFADGKNERLAVLADELVRAKVDVIVTVGTNSAVAARKATGTIPIVLAAASDPVGSGLAASLSRPGANVTGLALNATGIGPKNVELLMLAVPKLSRLAVLIHPDHPMYSVQLKAVRSVAEPSQVNVLPVEARNIADIEHGFAWMSRERAEAVIVSAEAIFFSQRKTIAALAMAHRLPSMFPYRDSVVVGGLMSYGTDLRDINRYAATYLDRIFKGAKPADLPIEEPSTLRLVINRQTAQALGMALPQELLLRADEVVG
jgi:putative tryptophan/tyrosine transport system substrate-binding protein